MCRSIPQYHDCIFCGSHFRLLSTARLLPNYPACVDGTSSCPEDIVQILVLHQDEIDQTYVCTQCEDGSSGFERFCA